MADIDTLSIQIEASATDAVTKVDALVTSFEKLKGIKVGSGLTTVSKQLQAIATASNALNSGGIGKIKALADSLKTLNGLENIKISSSLATQIGKLGVALNNIQWTDGDKVKALSDGLKPLTELGKAQLTTFINQLGKLPEVIEKLDAADIGKFAEQMKAAAEAIRPLADEMNKVAAGFSAFPSKIQKLIQSNSSLAASNTKTAKTFGVLGTGISSTIVKFGVYTAMFKRLASVMGGWVTESNDYVENLNLFTVAMGDYAQSAKAYAEEVQSVMGIDPSEWMRNQGVFMQMATGFGVVQDKAALMSKNLTQLGYDISSFYNISMEDAMLKLQSGMAGEIEPLRRLGYAIDVATLQRVAYNNGIEQSVNTMTQAQKAQLRYVAIMEQSGNAMGDLSRTIQTPANAMRILQQQITQLARAAGNLLIPALQGIIQVVQAVVEVITDAVQALANLFGFTLPTIDYSGLQGVSTGGEEAEEALGGASKAAKEFKSAMLGIDELNVISPPSAADSVSEIDAELGDLPLELPEYDFLGDLEEDTNRIKELLDPISKLISGIATGFASWKIASKLVPDLGILKGLLGGLLVSVGVTLLIDTISDIIVEGLTWENILEGVGAGAAIGGGLGLMLATTLGLKWWQGMLLGAVVGIGISLIIMGITDIISNGLSMEALTTILAGVAVAVAALAISGHQAAAGFVALAGGIIMVGASVYDAIKHGLNDTNLSGLLAGITVAVMGLYAAFGRVGAIIGGVVGGILLLITGFNDFIDNGITEHNILAIGAGFTLLSLAAFSVNKPLGIIIMIVGIATTTFLAFGDKVFGVFNVVVSAIKNGIAWLRNFLNAIFTVAQNASILTQNLFQVVFAVFDNMGLAAMNVGMGIYNAFQATVENIKTAFNNGWINIQSGFLGFSKTILNGIKEIANKINSLIGVFGIDINTSGITSQIQKIADQQKALQDTKGEYEDVGSAFAEGMSTFDYKDLGEAFKTFKYESVSDAFNTFSAFEDGWKEDARAAGQEFGTNLQQGFRDTLGGLRTEISNAMSEATSGLFDFLGTGDNLEDPMASAQTITSNGASGLTAQLNEYKESLSTLSDSVDTSGMKSEFDSIAESYNLTSQNMMADSKLVNDDMLSKIQGTETTYANSLANGEAAVKDATDSMTRMFRTMSNNSVSAINSIISGLNSIPRNITTTHTIVTKNTSSGSNSTKAFASGGFPEHGQLFLAREAGPELVGTIGGNTAVANNAQIVDGIRQGVAEAEQTQNALLREQNELLMAILQKTGTVSISGKTIKAAYDKESRQRGANIMSGGVLAY